MKRRTFLRNGLWLLGAPAILAARATPPGVRNAGYIGALSGPAAASCASKDAFLGTLSAAYSIGRFSGTIYQSGSFTPSSSYTVCKAVLKLAKVGSPTNTMQAFVYTESGTVPGTQVGTGSSTYNMSTAPASDNDFTFDNISAAVTSGTQYFLVVHASANDSSNYVDWSYAVAATGNREASSSDGSSWSSNNFTQLRMTIYGQ